MPINPVTGELASSPESLGIHPPTVLDQARFGFAVYTYDFAKHGGAISAIVMQGPALPPNAIVVFALLEVITTPTSGGAATIALGTGAAANDLQTATAYNGAPFSTTGIKALVPVMSAASAIDVGTTDVNPSMTIATAALTAGKFQVLVLYFVHD